MYRRSVSSSNIASMGYDPITRKLEVEFKNGAVYEYSDVDQASYDKVITSSSIGQYFHAYIKGRFSATKV